MKNKLSQDPRDDYQSYYFPIDEKWKLRVVCDGNGLVIYKMKIAPAKKPTWLPSYQDLGKCQTWEEYLAESEESKGK